MLLSGCVNDRSAMRANMSQNFSPYTTVKIRIMRSPQPLAAGANSPMTASRSIRFANPWLTIGAHCHLGCVADESHAATLAAFSHTRRPAGRHSGADAAQAVAGGKRKYAGG